MLLKSNSSFNVQQLFLIWINNCASLIDVIKQAVIFTSTIETMKNILLGFVAMIFSLMSSAQVCTPYWSDTTYGINPDTITNLPPAYVGSAYDIVIQFKVPATAIYNNLPINIDHIVLDSIGGLSAIPTSVPFYFNCNPADCSFKHDSVGCVRLQGTPSQVGTYNLVISTRVFLTAVLGIPVPSTGYKIVVNNAIGIPELNQNVFDVSQNFPNPVSSFTDVSVNLVRAQNFSIKISNLVGTEIFSQSYTGSKGLNHVTIDASKFAEGIYFYSINNGEQLITKRMIVSRK
jgi:hypothetical protein